MNPRRTLVRLVGVVGLILLAGLAPAPVVVHDRFNDNDINRAFWDIHKINGMALREKNQRLEFMANGATSPLSYAGLEIENWGAKWRSDFQVEVDYHLNLNNVTGNRQVLLGVGLAFSGRFPESATGYGAAVIRDDVGLLLAIARFNNGQIVSSDSIELEPGDINGELHVEYDRSDDRLKARVGPRTVHLNNLWAIFGTTFGSMPMVISIGCTTENGDISFNGSEVYLDDFQFEGIKRSR